MLGDLDQYRLQPRIGNGLAAAGENPSFVIVDIELDVGRKRWRESANEIIDGETDRGLGRGVGDVVAEVALQFAEYMKRGTRFARRHVERLQARFVRECQRIRRDMVLQTVDFMLRLSTQWFAAPGSNASTRTSAAWAA